jgi:hypothetical protein
MAHFATTKLQCFFGAICGNRADYFAQTPLDNAVVCRNQRPSAQCRELLPWRTRRSEFGEQRGANTATGRLTILHYAQFETKLGCRCTTCSELIFGRIQLWRELLDSQAVIKPGNLDAFTSKVAVAEHPNLLF